MYKAILTCPYSCQKIWHQGCKKWGRGEYGIAVHIAFQYKHTAQFLVKRQENFKMCKFLEIGHIKHFIVVLEKNT